MVDVMGYESKVVLAIAETSRIGRSACSAAGASHTLSSCSAAWASRRCASR